MVEFAMRFKILESIISDKHNSLTSERWSLLAPFPGQDWQNSMKYILKKLTMKYYKYTLV